MWILETILTAISTYSVIPVPQFDWNEKNMRYAICAFPAVGLLCGGALFVWYLAAKQWEISAVLFAAVSVGLPLLLTGGIHMDGYMDTIDALASHRPRERKLEILKDSACGAFAVLYAGIYLLLSFAFFYELFCRSMVCVLAPTYVLSRALSGYCAVTMPNARKAGMLCAYTEHAKKRTACVILLLEILSGACAAVFLSLRSGMLSVCAALLCTLAYRRMAMREFGGVTGDTSGFFLQLCELSCLIGVWVGTLM